MDYGSLSLNELSDVHGQLVEEKQKLEWEIFNLQGEISQRASRLNDIENSLASITPILQSNIPHN